MTTVSALLSLPFPQHKHFCFPFFLTEMPGTDSPVLFSTEVGLTAAKRMSLAGDEDAWAGAVLGLVPKAASSQISSKQESDCLGWRAAGYDHDEVSWRSSCLCCAFFLWQMFSANQNLCRYERHSLSCPCFPAHLCITCSGEVRVRPLTLRAPTLNT